MIPTSNWYADGFRWIGSLFSPAEPAPTVHSTDGQRSEYLDPEEFLFDVRHRMQNRI